MADLKARILEETRLTMKARDKERLAALRLINAEIKRLEVDERRELGEEDVLGVLNRMLKQRRDSLGQFEGAGREDLAAQERMEIELIEEFLPAALTEEEMEALVARAVSETGAESMKDMGRVMAAVKAAATGRVDMALVSDRVKARLG